MADRDFAFQELVAEVAAAYFSNSPVAVADIPNVVAQIATSLSTIRARPELNGDASPQAAAEAPIRATPAQVRKSVTRDGLISFEDGKAYKTLKRHLSGRGLTPEQYREKWGLPSDYPMVAPAYSQARSEMAKTIGLGQKGRGGKPTKPASRGRA